MKFSYCKILFLFIVVNIIFITFANFSTADLNEDLVAWYPFNDNANDESGNENHGTIFGASISKDRFNNPNSCLMFDGINDSVQIKMNSDFHFKNASVTYSVWVVIEDNSNTYRPFVSIADKNDDTPRISLAKSRSGYLEGRIYMQLYDGKNHSIALSQKNGDNLPKNEWLHIVGMIDYSSSKLYLFINGELQQSVEIFDYDLTSVDNLGVALGTFVGERGYHKGFLDDIRIYNKALTKEEIDDLYYEEAALFGCIKMKNKKITNSSAMLIQSNEYHQKINLDANGCYKFNKFNDEKPFTVIIRGNNE